MNKQRMDRGTALGAILAISGVVAGLLLDGGTLRQILQPTAALIVLGGTLGAIMMQFPAYVLVETARSLHLALFEPTTITTERVDQLARYCARVKRHGMLSLDAELAEIEDPFLQKALTLAVDGVNLGELRVIMEIELVQRQEQEEQIARVLEAAGGFSPTLGIVGAVLGLIQVVQNLENLGEVGRGIAVAFVSTLYGIGLANLLLFPLAGKLRVRFRDRLVAREMTLEAVIALLEGLSASALRQRLEPYTRPRAANDRLLPIPELISR